MLHAAVIRPVTWYPYQAGMEYVGFPPDEARIHQARSDVICSASSLTSELQSAEIFRPETYWLSCVWMTVSDRVDTEGGGVA